MTLFLKRYILCVLLFNLAACSSMQTVNVEQAMQNPSPRGIDYGSLVEIRTLDKRSAKFRVTDITEEGLGGSKGFYRYEDMKSLRVENKNSNNKDDTLAWVLGILGVAALVALVASSDSVAVCAPAPCEPRP
jgi:hypothetical protein